jgi:hypothetical protein
MLIALAAWAAGPAYAQSTDTNTQTQTQTSPNGTSTTVTTPSGSSTTINAPSGSTVTTDATGQTTITGSGGDQPTATTTTTYEVTAPRTMGTTLTLMGGAIGYRGTIQGGTNAGPAYGVALGVNNEFVGIEGSYQGATYTPSGTSDFTGGANRITENGAQVLLKVGPQLGPVGFYALGGGGVDRFTVSGGSAVTNVAGGSTIHDGTVWKVPAGVGIDFHVPTGGGPDMLIGARGQYNFLFNQNDVFSGVSNSSRDADQIEGQLNVGMMF